MKYDYIVWDFNGTVLDDLDLCLNILNEMLSDRGIKTVTKEQYKDVFTFPIIDYYKAVGFDFNKESFAVLGDEFINKYQKNSFNCNFCIDVIETIEKIKEMHIPQILLSASKLDNLKEQLRELKIEHLFDEVYGIEDIYAKSKLEIAKKFRNNHLDKNILMVGDSLHDAQVASEIDATCILINQGHQSKERLLTSGCIVVETAKEILEYIK